MTRYIQKFKTWLELQFIRIHSRLFNRLPSENTLRFAHGLGWSFVSGGIASVVMMALNISSGRILGPAGYGVQNLVLTIATLLSTIATFGLGNASIQALSITTNSKEKKEIIATVFYPTTAIAALLSIIFWYTHHWLIRDITLTNGAVLAAIVLSIVLSLKTLLDGFVRGLDLFAFQAKARIAETISAVIVFVVVFLWLHYTSSLGYIGVLILSAAIPCLIYLLKVRPSFGQLKFSTLRSLFHYGSILFLGTVLGTVFNNIDRFLIAKYLSLQELGLYSAYYAASTNLIAQLVQIFINAFFPAVSRTNNKLSVVHRVDKLLIISFIPGVLILIGFIGLIILLFGKGFLFSSQFIVLFSVLGVLQFFSTIYAYIITSMGAATYKKLLLNTNIINVIHLCAYAGLIITHNITISAIVLLYIINVSVLIIRERRILYRYLDRVV